MTARKPPTNYGQLAARFGTVRRAWKRAAALSGLAIVATESIGILTALLFLDWLYQPLPLIRIAMWTVAVACIGYFLARTCPEAALEKNPRRADRPLHGGKPSGTRRRPDHCGRVWPQAG